MTATLTQMAAVAAGLAIIFSWFTVGRNGLLPGSPQPSRWTSLLSC